MAVFTVVLSQAVGTLVGVDWATQDGSGPSAAVSTGLRPDYVASSGTVIFQADQLTASFTVPVLNNSLFTNNRYFLVNLSNSATVSIDRPQARATIIGDKNIPALTVGNAYVVKHTGSFTYNGQAGTAFTFGPTTTAAQLTSALTSIPALAGNVTVTGNPGGPFTITFSGGTNSALLQFANPGQLIASSATSATFTTSPIIPISRCF